MLRSFIPARPRHRGSRPPVEAIERRILMSVSDWLTPASAASYDQPTDTYTLTAPATIHANPGAEAPKIRVTGAAANLTIAPTNGLVVRLGGLTLENGAVATLPSLGAERTELNHRALIVDHPAGISIDATSTLDLADNALVVDYTSSSDNPAAAIEDLVARAYNWGDWTGTGITSSVAAEDYNMVVLATADNNNAESEFALAVAYGTAQGGPLFAGQDVDATSVLIKFTRRLDLDLDGSVTWQDMSIFNGNYQYASTWSQGDLNYDGVSDFQDLSIWNGTWDPTPAPAAPAFIDAAASSGSQITITWDAVPDATSYRLYRVSGTGPVTGSETPHEPAVLGTTFIDAGLPTGGMYTYAVKAVSGAGPGPLSDAATAATAPAAPQNVEATPISDSRVDIDWDDVPGDVTYDVYAGTSVGFPLDDGSLIAAGLPDDSYSDLSVVGSTDYYYAVVAVGPTGSASSASSPPNGPVTTPAPPPPAPTGLEGTGGAGRIDLTWTASDGADKYFVYRAEGSAPFAETPLDDNVTGTTFFDGNLPAGTTYRYAVSAVNADSQEGSRSASVTVTTQPLPGGAANLSATALSGDRIVLFWDDGEHEDGYRIERTIPDTDPVQWEPLGRLGANASQFYDGGLEPDTGYSYRVTAFNAAGDIRAEAYAATINWPQPEPPPAAPPLPAPTAVQATAASTTSFTVSWEHQSGTVPVTGFEIVSSSFDVDPVIVGPDVTSTTVSGFAPSFESNLPSYSFRVRALSDTQVSEYSDSTLPLWTRPAAGTPPAAPSHMTGGGFGTNRPPNFKVMASWTDNANDEVGYFFSTVGGTPPPGASEAAMPFVPTDPVRPPVSGTGQRDSINYGVAWQGTYEASVRAYNAAGFSDPATMTVTTPLYGYEAPTVQVIDVTETSYTISIDVPEGYEHNYPDYPTLPNGDIHVDDLYPGYEEELIIWVTKINYDTDDPIPTARRVTIRTLEAPSNDPPPPTIPVSVSAVDPAATEAGETPGRFVFSRTSEFERSVSVKYKVTGSASTSDYTGPSGDENEITIPAGAAAVVVQLSAKDDALLEAAEDVKVIITEMDGEVLDEPQGTDPDPRPSAAVTIASDDVPDIDIDSNNDGTIDTDNSRDGKDDPIEADADKPGKIIVVNDNDSDGDGVIDWADGFRFGNFAPAPPVPNPDDYHAVAGESFTPVVLRIPEDTDTSAITFTLAYPASDPAAITHSATGDPDNSVVHALPATGSMRLWTKDGSAPRSATRFDAVSTPDAQLGYFVPAVFGENSFAMGDWDKLAVAAGGQAGDHTITLWAEAVRPSVTQADHTITLAVDVDGDGSGETVLSDAARVTGLRIDIAADNNRDDTIKLDGSDRTSDDKPFVFWLNDNHDVWGGQESPAAQSAVVIYDASKDSSDNKIGGNGDVYGNVVRSSTAIREIAERDLEDFAQFGLRWSTTFDAQITGFRLRLESEDDMSLRVFISSRGGAPANGAFPATSGVTDAAAIDRILQMKDAPGAGRLMTSEKSITWTAGEEGALGTDTFTGPGGDHYLQLMFEGVSGGDGTLHFELMNGGDVLVGSRMTLRLREAQHLYDHYSVSYGPNVDHNGVFTDDLAFDPLDLASPLPTQARLEGTGNLERPRIRTQSDDYFLFVHGWRMPKEERVAFAESAFKRMYWSGYKGQFGLFDWPTLTVDDPTKDAGNYDRSEFVAWNSGAGLSDALRDVRRDNMPSDQGKLSVMAHSMGNIALAEALYQNQAAATDLVDTAIMSQAALSSAYFSSRADLLPSIYKHYDPGVNTGGTSSAHINLRTVPHTNPSWTEYKGFRPGGANVDAIGGLTPRFRFISEAAGEILNYYNPDDYALGGWKMIQTMRPTYQYTNGLNLMHMSGWLDYGNVTLPGMNVKTALTWLRGRDVPGFAETEYALEEIGGEVRIVRRYTGGTDKPDVTLTFSQNGVEKNAYEMFAFGASSIVAPVGAITRTGMQGVFGNDADLRQLDATTKFTTANTGHSAQFLHSFRQIKGYWSTLFADID